MVGCGEGEPAPSPPLTSLREQRLVRELPEPASNNPRAPLQGWSQGPPALGPEVDDPPEVHGPSFRGYWVFLGQRGEGRGGGRSKLRWGGANPWPHGPPSTPAHQATCLLPASRPRCPWLGVLCQQVQLQS